MNRLQYVLLQRPLDVHSAQPFSPQEMSSDVKEVFCHSFSFAVVTEQQAEIDEHYSSCTTLLRDLWSGLHNEFHYPQRRGLSDDSPTATEMFK